MEGNGGIFMTVLQKNTKSISNTHSKPFVKLSYAMQQLLRRGQGAGSTKEKYPLNTSTDEKHVPFRYSRKRFPSARAGRGIHHPDLRRYGHTEQWFTCGSPLPATGLETGNGLSFLFPAYPTEGDRQAIRAEPQRSGLPYSQGCPAASRRNGGNDA